MWKSRRMVAAVLFAVVAGGATCEAQTSAMPRLTMVVMDPLAKELSCPCVQGYAQRDYHRLAEFLQQRLGQSVEVVFAESLVRATKETEGRADLVIGKRSVVEFDAARLQRAWRPVAALTGKDGRTTQTGLIVVRADDPAQGPADLKSHRLIFGPAECEEKHAAALDLLKAHGVPLVEPRETVAGCEEGAVAILEMPPGKFGAAVISSYAKPLLEGCGTVPKGAIRVVGETKPVPFVTAFTSSELNDELRRSLTAALAAVAFDPELLIALESQRGFTTLDVAPAAADENAAEAGADATPASSVKKK